jgi:hypothetical protein
MEEENNIIGEAFDESIVYDGPALHDESEAIEGTLEEDEDVIFDEISE